LVKWGQGAYFLIGEFCFCLNVDLERKPQYCYKHYAFIVSSEVFEMMADTIQNSGAQFFKENIAPSESFYFLDPDGHKLEIHVGNSKDRIANKKAKLGK